MRESSAIRGMRRDVILACNVRSIRGSAVNSR
jgi:hypothetical protein